MSASAPAALQPRLGDRSLFPTLAPVAYLNHAAISPPSLPVQQAIHTIVDDYARHGTAAFMRWAGERQRLRGLLARLIGAEAEDIALVANTTRGVSDIALCLPWRPGDRVLLFQGEFPANITPWQRAAELFQLELEMLPVGDFHRGKGLDHLREALRRPTRLVAVSAVQFQTGLRMPVAEMAALCHESGAELFVDAIQALGVCPLDVGASGIDYLSAGSHKWMMGTEGLACLYVRRDRVAALRPNVAGWLSHEDGLEFLFGGADQLRYDRAIRKRADFVEGGAYNTIGCVALAASLDLILALGVPAIFDHVLTYLDELEDGLCVRGFTSLRARAVSERSGILSVHPPRNVHVADLQRALADGGIACSTPDGALRFAPHWPNDMNAEIPRVLAAIDTALGNP
ncbi:MAG: aminotransferase class V-fold PLP-dependent enzyme [Nannocystis sp.]|nr:aminotransferase class V-fold PLP-dependent enzyme [Nannocystis sp.]MBA3546557.1 aminotransferase class V-fold PLP-dependent enzyme [Nannocystis sp.]